ncbi:hypothetical protein CSOJ01_15255 [Colletotrichum sojae]|uniref:Cytochrome P450 n=1 Tax=Colletotrichum sojae TaxID=2175907 RepID=A0A8H6MI35_9PEZI|nr:hypothetical protein CSOJ01_15255 [Colletotrichum sojae]
MQSIAALVLSLAACAAAAPRSVDNSGPFQIYAYGSGIGGLSLFSSGGDAFFGDHTKMNDTNAAPVIFTPTSDSSTVWTGAPNTTDLGSNSTLPSWSNVTFSIPSAGSGDHSVGFLSSNSSSSSDRQTSGFIFYGTFIFVEGGSTGMESMWYATPSSVDGVYNLRWNETGDATETKIPLTLKKTPPSSKTSKTI